MKQLSFWLIRCCIMILMFSCCKADDIKFKRLVILLDQKGIENVGVGGMSAGTSALALALHQQACSILTSPSMLLAFLERKYPQIQSNQVNIFTLASFDLKQWRIYYLKNSNLFFLSPRNQYGLIQDTPVNAYDQQFSSYEKILITEKDLALGIGESKEIIIPLIKTQNLEPFLLEPANPQKLHTWINQKKQINRIFEIGQLESLFFYENDFKAMPLLLDALSFIDRIQASKVSTKEIAYAIPPKTIKFPDHKVLSQARDLIQTKIDFIKSATAAWNIYVFGHGSYEYPPQGMSYSVPLIVDLRAIDDRAMNPHHGKPNQLTPFLLFFNKINTNLIALSSCYSGGKSLNYLRFKEGLRKDKIANKLSYILAVLSSTDTETTTVTGTKGSGSTAIIDWNTSTNIERFFQYLDHKPNNEAEPNWLTDALYALALPLDHPENIPQVLIPGQEWFQVFTPIKAEDKNAIILNSTLIKEHQKNKTKLDLNNDKKIFLATNTIPIDITINTSKPLPQFISKIPGDTFHAFSKIIITHIANLNLNNAINTYIEKFFCLEGLKSNETEKIFFIKNFEVIATNMKKLSYQNILITVDKNGWSFETLPSHDKEAKKFSNYLLNPPNLPVKRIKNKAIVALGDVLIKKHEIENRVLDLSDVQTVLLSKDIIPIDLLIDASTTIPQFISRVPGDASHIFKKIVIQNAIKARNEYLAQLFLGTIKSVEAEKKIFIQDLEIINNHKNSQLFKNILITLLKNKLGLSELSNQNAYSKALAAQLAEKPDWIISKPQSKPKPAPKPEPIFVPQPKPAQPQLPGKLSTLSQQLTKLKLKLRKLAQSLKNLRSKLSNKTDE